MGIVFDTHICFLAAIQNITATSCSGNSPL